MNIFSLYYKRTDELYYPYIKLCPGAVFDHSAELQYGFLAKATIVVLPLIKVVVVENFIARFPDTPLDQWIEYSVEFCMCKGGLYSAEFLNNCAFRNLLQPSFPGYDVVSFQRSEYKVPDLWSHIHTTFKHRFPDFVTLELAVRKFGCDSEVAKMIYSKFAPTNLNELAKPYDFVVCSAKPTNVFKLPTLFYRW